MSSNSKKTKWAGEKLALQFKTCIEVNKLDGCLSNSIVTLLVCLQYSDKIFGGGDVSSDVL